MDLVALVIVVVFFSLGLAYTRGCDRLKGDRR